MCKERPKRIFTEAFRNSRGGDGATKISETPHKASDLKEQTQKGHRMSSVWHRLFGKSKE